MKNVFRKFVSVFFALMLVVGVLGTSVTSVHAASDIQGYMSWDKDGWYGGLNHGYRGSTTSAIVSTDFPEQPVLSSYLQEGGTVFHAKQYVDCYPDLAGGCNSSVRWDFWSPGYQTLYYALRVDFLHGSEHGYTWKTNVAGVEHSTSGTETSSFGVNQGSRFSVTFYTPQSAADQSLDFEALVYVNFSLNSNPPPMPSSVTLTPALVYIDPTESNGGANDAAWSAHMHDYFNEMNMVLAKNTNKRIIYDGNIHVTTASGALGAVEVFGIPFTPCNIYGSNDVLFYFSDLNIPFTASEPMGYAPGRNCDGRGLVGINTGRMGNSGKYSLSNLDWVVPSYETASIHATDPGDGSYSVFWSLVSVLLHEYKHTFDGRTVPEGYWYRTVLDEGTMYGGAPRQSISASIGNPFWDGDYWDENGDYAIDHMRNSPTFSLVSKYNGYDMSHWRDYFQFDPVSAAFITLDETRILEADDCADPIIPDFSGLDVYTLNYARSAVSQITVKAWYMNVHSDSPRESNQDIIPANQQLGTWTSDSSGHVFIPWTHSPVCPEYANGNPQRFNTVIIKTYYPNGTQFGDPYIVSTFNLVYKAFSVLEPAADIYALNIIGENQSHTVSFSAGSGGSGSMSPQTSNHTTNLTPMTNQLWKTGYSFVGWNTAADGSGQSYPNNGIYDFQADLTLYAQWGHIVTFLPNGGTETMEPQGSTTEDYLNPSVFFPPEEGLEFVGWNTAPDGTGTSYIDVDLFSFDADVTLYAQWNYVVEFNSTSCGVSPEEQVASGWNNLIPNPFTNCSGYFIGWNTEADGSGTSYADEANYLFNANATLYAQWGDTVFHAVSGSSGWVRSDGTTATGQHIVVGDSTANTTYRGIMDFDTSAIPDNAVIDSVTLTLHKVGITGNVAGFGPPSAPNAVAIDIGNPYCFGSACVTVQSADYSFSGTLVGSSCAQMPAACANPITVTLTSDAFSHIDKTWHTDLRLRFNTLTDSDGVADYVSYYNAQETYPPYLTITYHLP